MDATQDELTRLIEKPLVVAEFFKGTPGEKRFGAMGEVTLEPLGAEGKA